MSRTVPVKDLILIPAIISLVITLIRLAGEVMGGSALLFNSAAGGGGALIGISWLPPIFGAYFAWKLIAQGSMTTGTGRTAGMAALGLLLIIACMFLGGLALGPNSQWLALVAAVASGGAIWICKRGWKELNAVLLAYGLAARIPVAVIMLIAMLGDWRTHYDLAPPGFPEGMNVFLKWILIGLVPQLTIWIAFTMIMGSLFGALVMLVKGKQGAAAPA